MSSISLIQPDRDLFSWPQYWAACFGPAPFLPMSREEMDQLGWDSCDIILVTGDAYVDHPSFGMAICGRMLEAQGFRVGIMSSISLIQPDRDLFSWPQYWAACFGPAPFLPMSREEMDQLGWYSCDIILVTGDAYVDHPSFGMAICGRLREAQGFRVGIIAQPDWSSKDDFMRLGKPNLFFGVTAGNMDSMINRYTADRRLRHDDAYTPDNVAGKRPDRATLVYTQRCKEAWKDVPVILGGIEASLRRTAHYDYWSDTVRRSVLVDSKADMLMFGNGERPLVEVAHRLAMGEPISEIRDVRNTAIIVKEALPGWSGVDSTRLDTPGKIDPL